jgi:hypothetical protein
MLEIKFGKRNIKLEILARTEDLNKIMWIMNDEIKIKGNTKLNCR